MKNEYKLKKNYKLRKKLIKQKMKISILLPLKKIFHHHMLVLFHYL